MIFGSDGTCLRKDYRLPECPYDEDAGLQAEAYNHWDFGCAACFEESYTPLPIHSRAFCENLDCIFPFMALHHAYILSHQCGTWTHDNGASSISCNMEFPALVPFVYKDRTPKAVTFSAYVDTINFADEIGMSSFSVRRHDDYWIDKPTSTFQQCDYQHRFSHGVICNHFPTYTGDGDAPGYQPNYVPTHPPVGAQDVWAQQPEHIQDLGLAFQEFGDTDEDGNPFFRILTWYIHGHDHRDCRRPRLVRLGSDFMSWTTTIRQAWRGLIQHGLPVHYYVVHPEPPISEEDIHVAHLILVQAPRHHERAVVLSAIYEAPDRVALHHIARFTPNQLALVDAIELVEIPDSVRHRRITGLYGWRPLLNPPQPLLDIQNGASLRLQIHPPIDRQTWTALDTHGDDSPSRARSRSPRRHRVEADESSFMAHRPQLPQAPGLIMDNPAIARQQTDELQEDSDTESSPTASTFDSEEPSHFFHIFQLEAEMVASRIQTSNWAMMFSNVRNVLGLSRHQIQQLHVVTHLPTDLKNSDTQVALVQHYDDLASGDLRCFVLVDIAFHGASAHEYRFHRYVKLLPERSTRSELLLQLGVARYCNQPGVRRRCLIRHNHRRIPLQDVSLHDFHHADYIRVDLPPLRSTRIPTLYAARGLRDGWTMSQLQQRYPEDPDADLPWETVVVPVNPHCAEELEDVSLLQHPFITERLTAGSVAHDQRPVTEPLTLRLDEVIPAPCNVQTDFSSVIWAEQTLQQCHLPIDGTLPPTLEVPDSTIDALRTLVEAPDEQIPLAFHFYVDGSKVAGHQVGAAVLLLCEYTTGWVYGGHLCSRVDGVTHAFFGEHAAMIWALLWALRCSDWISQAVPGHPITFGFYYDATTTGMQAAGRWRTWQHKSWCTLMRALVHILQERHTPHALSWQHVKAHNDHPWNELVDRLAKSASLAGLAIPACEPWQSWLANDKMLNSLQWLWYLEHLRKHPIDAPAFDGMFLEHQVLRPARKPSPLQGHSAQPHQDIVVKDFTLTIATVNVLTLDSRLDGQSSTVTRQRILQAQFHEAGCHVVALQETRHKHIIDQANEHYHIIGHSACGGADGVQLWFTKKLRITNEVNHFQRQHLKIVDSSPSHLIVMVGVHGLRHLFVTGHAPHSGHSEPEAIAFWERISQNLRRFDASWTIIFLGDANAHLGSSVSAAVGSLAATKENQAGAVFHEWLLEHELFLPSTFEEHHKGNEHSTFVSPDGHHSTRIDYVALPRSVSFVQLQTWVCETIDIAMHRTDHLPLMCTFSWQSQQSRHQRLSGKARINIPDFISKIQHPHVMNLFYEGLSSPCWQMDPHQSAASLAQQTWHTVKYITDKCPQWRRKHHLLDTTWQMIEQKKQAFRQLRTLRRTGQFTILHAVYLGWRSIVRTPPSAVVRTNGETPLSAMCTQLPEWLRLHDHAVAQTAARYRQLSVQVLAAVRQEDVRYYTQLASDAGRTFLQEGLTGLWKKLKAILPKHRARRVQQSHYLGEGLQRHFEHLEAGSSTSPEALFEDCLNRNDLDISHRPHLSILDLAELPTLVEIEDLCLRQRPGKSPGPDGVPSDICRNAAVAIAPTLHNLFLKSFLSGYETGEFQRWQLASHLERQRTYDRS